MKGFKRRRRQNISHINKKFQEKQNRLNSFLLKKVFGLFLLYKMNPRGKNLVNYVQNLFNKQAASFCLVSILMGFIPPEEVGLLSCFLLCFSDFNPARSVCE